MTNEVLLIGVDAGDYRTIDRLVNEGRMPTFKSLIEDGYDATLESSVPPWTPTAWTSLTSGQNPGKHGIFDFKTSDGERLVNSTDVRTNRIWDYLDTNGLRSIVVNVPITHPAPDIDGILIPGYLGPEAEDAIAQPEGIIEELKSNIGEYRIYKSEVSEEGEPLCQEYIRLMKMRRDAIKYLCNEYEWNFSMVQFQRTDTVFHELPEQRYIDQVYEKLDEYINDIITSVDADTVVIVSDHGMGETGDWDFKINSWLKKQNYLETSKSGFESGFEKPTENDETKSGTMGRAVSILAKAGVTPQKIELLLSKLRLANTVKSILPAEVLSSIVSAGGEKINRSQSSAYCPSGPGLGIVCDEEVKQKLVEELSRIKDPDGNLLFEWVRPKEQVLQGPAIEDAPDLYMMPRQMNYYMSATPTSTVFSQGRYDFNHKNQGILLMNGQAVRSSEKREQCSIHDIAPTILTLLDLPLDREFDGSPIKGVLNVDHTEPIRYDSESKSIDEDISDSVESRLEDLGYME